MVHLTRHWVPHVPPKHVLKQKHFLPQTLGRGGGKLVPGVSTVHCTPAQSARKLGFKNFKFTNFLELSIYWNKYHSGGEVITHDGTHM